MTTDTPNKQGLEQLYTAMIQESNNLNGPGPDPESGVVVREADFDPASANREQHKQELAEVLNKSQENYRQMVEIVTSYLQDELSDTEEDQEALRWAESGLTNVIDYQY